MATTSSLRSGCHHLLNLINDDRGEAPSPARRRQENTISGRTKYPDRGDPCWRSRPPSEDQ